jgi:hypothetical protein
MLDLALNVVIGLLIALLVLLLLGVFLIQVDPQAKQDALSALESTGGDVPALPMLTIGGGIGAIIMASAYLYVAFVIKKIVKTTLNGNPFVDANISRLRTTWVVIALVEIFRMILMGFITSSGKDGTALEGFSVETNLSAWFLVFVIAAMAEVFRIGLELRRDQELTV